MNDKLNFAELKTAGVLPSPRGVALTVMQLCQTDNVSLPDLAHTIQADPVLAGRIIKIANLVNPNKSRPIASISIDTLILIGIHAVRQVVLGFSLITSYQKGACKAFDYSRYWSRSVAMASASQALGAVLRVAPPAEIFTCGLLAGIGQLGMAAARPEEYSALLEQHPAATTVELSAAETLNFGLSHNELSAEMMADWGIPRLFTDAVRHHEHPADGNFSEGSRQQRLACALQLSGALADVFLAPLENRTALLPRVFELAALVDLEAEQLVYIANQTMVEWQEWTQLLGIKAHAHVPPLTLEDVGEPLAGHDAPPKAPASQPADVRLRILFADADEGLVSAAARELAAAGHQVRAAKTARQAFEIAQRERPQVIIADWQATETGGATLCRRLREQSWAEHLHIIMLGAHTDEAWQIEALEAGADACMKKPFQLRLLSAQLIALQRRGSRG